MSQGFHFVIAHFRRIHCMRLALAHNCPVGPDIISPITNAPEPLEGCMVRFFFQISTKFPLNSKYLSFGAINPKKLIPVFCLCQFGPFFFNFFFSEFFRQNMFSKKFLNEIFLNFNKTNLSTIKANM